MGWLEELKSTEGLSTLLSARGPRLATAVLAVLIALQAGFMVTSQNRRIAPATPSASPQGAHQAPQLQVSSIVAAHLFGEAHSTDNDADAPQTSVQLVLAGVLAVPDPKRGLALIGPNAGTAKLYAVGSAVPGGVSLHAVYPDRVLLDRGGVIESLILPKKFTALTTQTAIAGGGQEAL